MIKLLVKKFIKDSENVTDKGVREKYGILGGVLGIICNVFLFGIKLVIGLMMNSIAIISDAVNNLSDTGSSLVTIIGTKLSSRHPDKEHPFGHGRMEYISTLIVSFLIGIVGFELLKSSFSKIIDPQPVEFNLLLIIILSVSVLIKVWMFSYNRYLGKKIKSTVLTATASDSLNDVIATSAVIISTIIGKFVSLPIDGIVGFIVSGMVIYTGFGIAKDTIDLLVGSAPDKELVEKIEKTVLEAEGIVGIHDLIVHDYGPGRVMASAHAEVPDTADIVRAHEIIDETEEKILRELGVTIVLHMDPITVNNEKVDRLKAEVTAVVAEVNPSYSIHDFRITDGEKNVNLLFDLAVPCEVEPSRRMADTVRIKETIMQRCSGTNVVMKIDNKF